MKLAPTGALWLNLGYMRPSPTETLPLTYVYYDILKSLGMFLVQELVWHYEGGMSYTKRFAHRTERWQWWVRNSQDYVFNLDAVRDPTLNRTNDKRNNPRGKNPTDYWYFNRVTGNSKEKTIHPCQFPVEMIERIILACSNPDDLVFDPFGGSGTTAVAAHRHGRRFIISEINERYLDVAFERLLREIWSGAGDKADLVA